MIDTTAERADRARSQAAGSPPVVRDETRGESRGATWSESRGEWGVAPSWVFPQLDVVYNTHFCTATSLYAFGPPKVGRFPTLGLTHLCIPPTFAVTQRPSLWRSSPKDWSIYGHCATSSANSCGHKTIKLDDDCAELWLGSRVRAIGTVLVFVPSEQQRCSGGVKHHPNINQNIRSISVSSALFINLLRSQDCDRRRR